MEILIIIGIVVIAITFIVFIGPIIVWGMIGLMVLGFISYLLRTLFGFRDKAEYKPHGSRFFYHEKKRYHHPKDNNVIDVEFSERDDEDGV
ncbi:MAG: hypothetical protein ACK5KR_07340 [Breznakia sp.]